MSITGASGGSAPEKSPAIPADIKTPDKAGFPCPPVMATIQDDDERLLARIGYTQVSNRQQYQQALD